MSSSQSTEAPCVKIFARYHPPLRPVRHALMDGSSRPRSGSTLYTCLTCFTSHICNWVNGIFCPASTEVSLLSLPSQHTFLPSFPRFWIVTSTFSSRYLCPSDVLSSSYCAPSCVWERNESVVLRDQDPLSNLRDFWDGQQSRPRPFPCLPITRNLVG